MKFVKYVLIFAVVLVLLIFTALIITLSSAGLQTALAKRFLPDEWTLNRLHAGFQGLIVEELVIDREDVHVHVERIQGDYSLLDAIRQRHLHLRELTATGLRVEMKEPAPPHELPPPKPPRVPEPTPPRYPPPDPEREPVMIPWEDLAVFDGLFRDDIAWPPASIDRLAADGVLTLPGYRQKIELFLEGNDFRAGGHCELKLTLEYSDLTEATPLPRGVLNTEINLLVTPDGLVSGFKGALSGQADAVLEDDMETVHVAAQWIVQRRDDTIGESYQLDVTWAPDSPAPREVLSLIAGYAYEDRSLSGEWTLNADSRWLDAFLTPYLNGTWATIRANGSFDLNPSLEQARLQGASVVQGDVVPGDDGHRLQPELEAAASFLMETDFTIAGRNQRVELNTLKAYLSMPMDTPLIVIEAKQPFGFDLSMQQPVFGDPDSPLALLTLRGFPTDIVNAFLPDHPIALSGLSGEVALFGDGDEFHFTTPNAIAFESFSMKQDGRPAVDDITLRLSPSGRYGPDTLTFDAGEVTLAHRDTTLALLTARGSVTNLHHTPRFALAADWNADLAALLNQPAAEPYRNLSEGRLQGSLSAHGAPEDWNGTLEALLINLVPRSGDGRLELVSLKTDVRMDDTPHIQAAGPLSVTAPDGPTDLEYELSLWPGDETTRINLKSRGETVRVDHFLLLAGAFQNPDYVQEETVTPPEKKKEEVPVERPAARREPGTDPAPAREPDTEPLWAGILADIDLSIRELILPGAVNLKEFVAQASVAEEAVRLTAFEAFIGESPARAQGALSFRSDRPDIPYLLEAGFSLTEFDVGAYLREVDAVTKPALEAAINMTGEVMAEASHVDLLGDTLTGEFSMNATDGVLRALRRGAVRDAIDVSGALGRAARLLDINRDVEAVGQLISYFDAIEFDQFSLEARRNPDLSIDLDRIFLQSRELLLEGRGRIGHEAERKFHQQPIALTLNMGARPPLARLFDELNLLQEEPDDAGYRFLNQAIDIQGNVSEPDPRPMWVVILNAAARTGARRLLGDREDREGEPTRELPIDRLPRLPRL